MLKDINGVAHLSVADALSRVALSLGRRGAGAGHEEDFWLGEEPGEYYHEAVRLLAEARGIYAGLRNLDASGERVLEIREDRERALNLVRCLMQTAELHR